MHWKYGYTSHAFFLCNQITFEIWNWCICHSVWLSIDRIPGIANVQADRSPRLQNYHTEWMLSKNVFNCCIVKLGVTPQIDLHHAWITNWSHISPTSQALKPIVSDAYQILLAVNRFHLPVIWFWQHNGYINKTDTK